MAIVLSLLLVILISVLSVFIYPVYRRRKVLEPIPGFKQDFLIGHVKYFYNKTPPEFYKIFERGHRELGRVWKLFMLHDTIVFVSDPKILEVLLTSNKWIRKSREYDFHHNWLAMGLITSYGAKWFSRRKAITPAFHFKILDEFMETFDKNSSILVDELKKNYKSTDPVALSKHLTLATLDNICETAMGATLNAQIRKDSDYLQAVNLMTYVVHMRSFNIMYRSDLTYKFTNLIKQEQKALKTLHGFTDSVIRRRRAELSKKLEATNGNNVADREEDQEFGIKKKRALMDILLETTIDGKPLTDADVREEVDSFMFAGHDTTTSAITFTLYCIAKYPEVQEKLIKEIHEVMGEDKTTATTMQMLSDLSYMDLVVKEVQRMYPTVPLIGRRIEEDIEIKNVKIPAGCNLLIGLSYLHNDPGLFPEPHLFKPERFSEVFEAREHSPYSYIPFSAGPRNCIGQRFAVLEIKSMISKVLRHFEISLDPSFTEPQLCAEVVLKSQNPILFNLKARK